MLTLMAMQWNKQKRDGLAHSLVRRYQKVLTFKIYFLLFNHSLIYGGNLCCGI